MSLEQTITGTQDQWPRVCTCNNCLHTKEFADFNTCFAATCDQCGEPAALNGYCWCPLCSHRVEDDQ